MCTDIHLLERIQMFALKWAAGSNWDQFRKKYLQKVCEGKEYNWILSVWDPSKLELSPWLSEGGMLSYPGGFDESSEVYTLWLIWSVRPGHRWVFQSVGKMHSCVEWKDSQENYIAVEKIKCSSKSEHETIGLKKMEKCIIGILEKKCKYSVKKPLRVPCKDALVMADQRR